MSSGRYFEGIAGSVIAGGVCASGCGTVLEVQAASASAERAAMPKANRQKANRQDDALIGVSSRGRRKTPVEPRRGCGPKPATPVAPTVLPSRPFDFVSSRPLPVDG